MKRLFLISAIIEAGAGVGLLLVPSTISHLLLGSLLNSPEAITMARVAGAALLSLGIGCCLSRREAASALAVAMLVYNIAVAAILALSGTHSTAGIALWPAVGLHAVMAIWCVIHLKSSKVLL